MLIPVRNNNVYMHAKTESTTVGMIIEAIQSTELEIFKNNF